MTNDELSAIEARAHAATPGPWRHGTLEKYHVFCTGTGWAVPDERVLLRMNHHFSPDMDARFIAHARTDVPALCAELRTTRERLATAEALLRDCDAYLDRSYSRALKDDVAAYFAAAPDATNTGETSNG